MRKKEITIQEKTILIEELPLIQYAELLSAIEELPKHVKDLDGQSNEAIIEKLPYLISVALPDVIRVIEVATPLEKKQIEGLGLADTIDIITVILEVNDYSRIVGLIKNAIAQSKIQK